MKTIYKYELPFADYTELKLPYYSQILSAINQYEKLVIYVSLDTEQTLYEEYTFRVIGTGHKIHLQHLGNFINTVSFRNGDLVFHIFYTVYK